jgi:hypothetical protein
MGGILFNIPAQINDVRLDGARRDGYILPDCGEQVASCHHLVSVADQVGEDLEFEERQMNQLASLSQRIEPFPSVDLYA